MKIHFKEKIYHKGVKKQTLQSVFLSLLFVWIVAVIEFYFFLPALNFKSFSFYIFLFALVVEYILIIDLVCSMRNERTAYKKPLSILGIIITIVLGASIFGMQIWHAQAYASLLKIDDGVIEDIPSVEHADTIALMDTASAEKLGDREIGSLTDVVSQFNVGEYMQIDYRMKPVKIAPLQYEDFFKWLNNRKRGVPGYVVVNPVGMSARYSALKEGMRYIPSAYFNDNLQRHLRFAYPFTMFDNLHFEIDEEGNPWYIASVYDHSISLFGGTKVTGAIFVNPVSGETKKLGLDEIPQWADVIFSGNLLTCQYNYAAKLQRGFLNSVFGQIDSRQVTTIEMKDEDGDASYNLDYGYISKDGDIWIFTGVTSVNGDSSNLGFIMANERTGETKYIVCSGADEGSAMRSAEGEVQEKGYHASFPTLINVDGIPTYIMVLKDNNGLVKMYACVNVEQYNNVITATTQKEVIKQYRRLMKGEISSDEIREMRQEVQVDTEAYIEKTITIKKMEKIDMNGNTYLYIVDMDDNVYQAKYIDVIGMVTVEVGDEIKIFTDGKQYLLEK